MKTERPLSLNINSNFLDSEPAMRLMEIGRTDLFFIYMVLMTHIRRRGCYVELDEAFKDALHL